VNRNEVEENTTSAQYIGPAAENIELKLDSRNFAKATLSDNNKALVLFDSGSSKTLVSGQFVQSSKYLSGLKPTATKPVRFRLGNGDFLVTESMLEFEIRIQGHKFKISALVADHLVGIDVILGTDTLADLEGSLDFRQNRFRIKTNKVHLKPTAKVTIKPGETKYVILKGHVPAILRNSEVIIRSSTHLAQVCPSQFIVRLRKGRAQIPVTNPTNKKVNLDKDRTAATLFINDCLNIAQPMPQKAIERILEPEGQTCSLKSNEVSRENLAKYPHLNHDDPIANLTESEALRKQVDLSGSILSEREKENLYEFLERHREAFSLYGELSSCPNFEVDFTLTNDDPFFIRPYCATDENKKIIQTELDKLVKLGILGVGHQAYTSPVLVIPKANSSEKRVCTDFRFLNARISRKNFAAKLLQNTLKSIGHSNAKVLSVIDLKSAFHSLPLSEKAQKYTGIASYHGGKHYFYKRLAMGLSVSPAIFQAKIDEILSEIPDSATFCEAHYDDLIIFSLDKETHRKHIKCVLEALEKHGLRISPSKAKLFRDSVVYMGSKISISKEGHACIEPLASRCSAIRNMRQPKTPKEVKRLIGAVNFVAGHFHNVQRVLKPLHSLTRKGKQFVWENEHEIAFLKVKEMMLSPAVLHLPKSEGQLRLYSDTSREATGSYVTQQIGDKEVILGYYSKILPSACKRYSVSELEMFGLVKNLQTWRYLLKGVEFEAYVDHSSLTQMYKSKDEPPTMRLTKLLLKLSDYSIKLGYRKGSELVLADFLSRNPRVNDTEIDQLIEPISFSASELGRLKPTSTALAIVSEGSDGQTLEIDFSCQTKGSTRVDCEIFSETPDDIDIANPITRAYAKKMGIEIPNLYPKRNETRAPVAKQVTTQRKLENVGRPERENAPLSEFDVPYGQNDHPVVNMPRSKRQIAQQPDESFEPRLVDRSEQPLVDCRESPAELITPPKPLIHKVESLVCKHIPRQYELDRMMKILKRKLVKDYNLPMEVKTIKTEQMTSPHFKDVYDNLAFGILPQNAKEARKVQIKSEQFILCNGILFRLYFYDDWLFKLQLALPESMAETVISQYHDSLLASHQGVIRTVATIRRYFYSPRLFDLVCNYIRACHQCQKFRGKPDKLRPFHERIPDEYLPMDRLSLDIKTMPKSATGFKYLLVCSCEITRYVIAVPLKDTQAETIAEAICQKIVCVHGPPSVLISDEATSFIGKIVSALCETLKIDQKTISVQNHGSLKVERSIKTLSNFMKVNLNQFGTDWVRFVPTACYSYNTFSTPYLANYSPFELVYMREPKDLMNLSYRPLETLSQSYEEYAIQLKRKFQHISRTMLQLQRVQQQSQNAAISRKLDKAPVYSVGQLVYLYKPTSSSLTSNTTKFKAEYVGPFCIEEIIDRTRYRLTTLKGEVLQEVFNFNRLKPCFVKASSQMEPITKIGQLKEALGQGSESKPKSEKAVPTFTDECGKELPMLSDGQILFIGCTEPHDVGQYLNHITENHGIAALEPLDKNQLVKQSEILESAPSVSDPFTVHRTRFKAGNLEALVSVIKRSSGQENASIRFWIPVDRYPEFGLSVMQLVLDRKLKCTGSPVKFQRMLYTL